jgi:hypothetical protein
MKTQQWNRFAGFNALANAEDLVCLSRIRWRWTDPRLKSVLAIAAQQWRVFFVEVMPPTWLNPFECADSTQRVVRVAGTQCGVWTVRPELMLELHGNHPDKVLSSVLRGFFQDAGVHEPVIWHLDAGLPHAFDDQPAWATLYSKPELHSTTCFDAKERAGDAALRERSDALLDASLLSLPPKAAWSAICDEIMGAACRRHAAPMMQFTAA